MSKRIVKVAYVTKWTGPIRVYRGFSATRSGALSGPGVFYVHSQDWTEDKAEAERRLRANRNKEIKAAERKLEAAAKALRDGPTWEER